ncbi:type II toxin-antitoxin system PemK/MazF family toxin [Streptococcus suis]|nr:type II toxin-antitoxin system PemK/MazF family toxin [Streptococcus suis]
MEEHPYFEDAKRNYNLVNNLYKSRKIRHTSTKYKFFAISTKRQSEQYLFEAENPKRKYWKFARGCLIFVEFGVNIGGELSNNHWAIVLDKDDTPYKTTLTVVPLTSKPSKNVVALNELIGYQSLEPIQNEINELNKLINSNQITNQQLYEKIGYLREVINYYKKYLKQSYAKCDSIQTISKDRILKKNPLDQIGLFKVTPQTLDAINDKIAELYLDK